MIGGATGPVVGERVQLRPGSLRFAEEDVDADVADPFAFLEQLSFGVSVTVRRLP